MQNIHNWESAIIRVFMVSLNGLSTQGVLALGLPLKQTTQGTGILHFGQHRTLKSKLVK